MHRTICSGLCVALGMQFATPALADDTGFEVIVIGERSGNDSDYSALSVRMPLSASAGNDGRTAVEGLRLRFDVARSNYDTGYDGVPGGGASTTSRLLLSYGLPLSEMTTLTLIGGISHRETQVRPVTKSSPADLDRTGLFVAAELEVVFSASSDLQLLLEHDGTAGDFAALTYLHGIGSVRIGPTFSYYSEDDYEVSRAGVVAAVDIAEDAELRLTATQGWPSLSGASADEVSSVQVQLRLAF